MNKVKWIVVWIIGIILAGSLGWYVGGIDTNKEPFSFGSNETRDLVPIFDNIGSTATGTRMYVQGYRNVICAWDVDKAATFTMKFSASVQDNAPNFGTVQSSTNRWDYIEVVDLEDGTAIDGDTGVSVAGTTDHRQFEINTNLLTWVTASTSWTAGTSSLWCKPGNNQ